VSSLQVEKKAVAEAAPGECVGHKTSRTRSELKEGLPVFVVRHVCEAVSVPKQ
jgi:hypothetical protein